MGFGGHGGLHGHSHDHDDSNHKHEHEHSKKGCSCSKTLRLSIMLSLTFTFFLVELIVGHITESLALTADSFHMLSDVIALCIGLFAVRYSKKKSSKNTFGWVRSEVLGALVNSIFLIALCLSILIEAIERFIETKEIQQVHLLLYVSCTGLAINLIGLVIFGHGHSHGAGGHTHVHAEELDDNDNELDEVSLALKPIDSGEKKNRLKSNKSEKKSGQKCCSVLSSEANLNIRAVFLHVLTDALGSVIVIISAILNIYKESLPVKFRENIRFVDPSLCLVLVGLVLSSTIPLFKETALILLQTVPKDIELKKLKEELQNVNGIVSIHELHVWKLSGNKIIATAHITCHNLEEYMIIASKVKILFHEKGIHSTTIQPEFVDSVIKTQNDCLLECVTDCDANTCCGQSSNQPNSIKLRNKSPKNSLNEVSPNEAV